MYNSTATAQSVFDTRLAKLLSALDVPTSLKGYIYLTDAIRIAANDPDTIYAVNKKIYAPIANEHNTSVECVGSAIRNAIKASWQKGDAGVQQEIFGHTVRFENSRPSESEYIAILSKKLQMEIPT